MADGRKHRKELQQFYGVSSSGEHLDTSYDINSKFFNQDMYVQKIIKVSIFIRVYFDTIFLQNYVHHFKLG